MHIVKETLLSKKPAKRGGTATFLFSVLLCWISLAYWNLTDTSDNWAGIPQRVFEGHEYWRLVTGMLIHRDISHLGANLLPFALLTYLIVGYFGWMAYFWMYPLGALTNLVSLMTYDPQTHLVGASGLVYVMAGFWVTLYVGIDRRFLLSHRLLRGAGFCLALLVPSTIEPGVSYRTHGIGFVIGLAFGIVYFFVKRGDFQRYEVIEIEDESFVEPNEPTIH